jgi:adenosylcobinamide-phosphate synthase
MGRLLGATGRWIAPRAPVSGAGCVCRRHAGLVRAGSPGGLIYAVLQLLLPPQPWWLAGALAGVLLKPLLSWRMLKDEVLAVEAALQQSLPAGRERLSWLVSRDTAQLDAATVRESAIETLAENLNDSVIAPLFWFPWRLARGGRLSLCQHGRCHVGLPGWRGRAPRRHWQWAGKWAARADDVLNWIPARITAAWLALLAGGVSWAGLRRDAA